MFGACNCKHGSPHRCELHHRAGAGYRLTQRRDGCYAVSMTQAPTTEQAPEQTMKTRSGRVVRKPLTAEVLSHPTSVNR